MPKEGRGGSRLDEKGCSRQPHFERGRSCSERDDANRTDVSYSFTSVSFTSVKANRARAHLFYDSEEKELIGDGGVKAVAIGGDLEEERKEDEGEGRESVSE